MRDYWTSVMAQRLAAQRAWNEHQRWLADARQKLAELEPDEPSVEPEQGCAWLLWGRHPDRGSMPLGCYRTRQVALDAEELHKAHENADEWDDIWVVPWPLASEPRVNFRMKYSSRPLAAEEAAEATSRTTDKPEP